MYSSKIRTSSFDQKPVKYDTGVILPKKKITYDTILNSLNMTVGPDGLLQIRRNENAERGIQPPTSTPSQPTTTTTTTKSQLRPPPQQTKPLAQRQQHFSPPPAQQVNRRPTPQPINSIQQQQYQPQHQYQNQLPKITEEVTMSIEETTPRPRQITVDSEKEKENEKKRLQALEYFKKLNQKKSKRMVFS